MSDTIILSDEEDDPKPPFNALSRKPCPASTIFLLDDDIPTPQKPPVPWPLVVLETPFTDIPNVKSSQVPPRGDGYVCLEDESFSPSPLRFLVSKEDMRSIHVSGVDSPRSTVVLDDIYQVEDYHKEENLGMEQIDDIGNANDRTTVNLDKNDDKSEALEKKKMTTEERKIKKAEEKMKKATLKAQEKRQKTCLKVQAAELKKVEKEKKKWETGKFALKSIVAEVDTKVVEQESVGGHLLTKFSEKNLAYRITSNPIEYSIVWRMNLSETISQLPSEGIKIRYVLLVCKAEEFCNLVAEELFLDHVARVRSYYPSYTICYLTNRLTAYIAKREREKYKNPEVDDGWRCPPIEEVLSKLTTHYHKVHHRQCRDEAELAEHVVGLTCSLALCQYRTKLTRLSISANGLFLPKDCVDRMLIKKSPWLKALVAIPKVQPRFAIAIWKKYPTMKSLLSEYMDPHKSVHEKEFLLQDLTIEGLLGGERRVGQICSKRVYRILMAKSGSIRTDDVEDGADLFTH